MGYGGGGADDGVRARPFHFLGHDTLSAHNTNCTPGGYYILHPGVFCQFPPLILTPGYNPAKQMCAGQHDGHKWVEAGCGDSGGPLLYKSPNGNWIQSGVVSWGYGNDYDIYTRISGYKDWVLGCMNDENECRKL